MPGLLSSQHRCRIFPIGLGLDPQVSQTILASLLSSLVLLLTRRLRLSHWHNSNQCVFPHHSLAPGNTDDPFLATILRIIVARTCVVIPKPVLNLSQSQPDCPPKHRSPIPSDWSYYVSLCFPPGCLRKKETQKPTVQPHIYTFRERMRLKSRTNSYCQK